MTYEVLKDYDDIEKIPTSGGGTREKTLLSLKVGEKFVPAAVGYPQNKVDALVLNGTLKLIEKEKPVETEPVAPPVGTPLAHEDKPADKPPVI